MKNFCLVLLLFHFIPVHAQYDPSKVNKKAAKWYLKSQDQARDDKFEEGIASLKEALRIDDHFEDAYLSMAGMYGELKNYSAAIDLSLIHISEPTRQAEISYAVFCL